MQIGIYGENLWATQRPTSPQRQTISHRTLRFSDVQNIVFFCGDKQEISVTTRDVRIFDAKADTISHKQRYNESDPYTRESFNLRFNSCDT